MKYTEDTLPGWCQGIIDSIARNPGKKVRMYTKLPNGQTFGPDGAYQGFELSDIYVTCTPVEQVQA